MTDSIVRSPTQVDLAVARVEKLIEGYRRSGNLRLPREVELSAQLGISRNTLREALARLAARGVIDRRRRLGTMIVAEREIPSPMPKRLSYPIDEIISLPHFFQAEGADFAIRSVAVGTEEAGAADADVLGLAPGAPVYRVRRVFAQGDVSAAVGEHVLPTVVGGHGIHIEALTDGISNFLKDVENISVDVVRHTVSAIAADAPTAHDLKLPVGSPVLAVAAELCTREDDALRAVAIGRLLLNPQVLTVSATGLAG